MHAVCEEATRRGALLNSSSYPIAQDIKSLAQAIGGSIRVRATGLPLTYAYFLHFVLGAFFVCAPLAWAGTMGWCA
jgi:predicted membrane chloride channel (bestrophin family)